jgi:hypothetical protein
MDADLTSEGGGTGGCWKVVVVRGASSLVGAAVWNEKSGYDSLCSSLLFPPCSSLCGGIQLYCCDANAPTVGEGKI